MTVSKKSYFIKESIVIKESGFVMTRIEKKEILSDEKTKKVSSHEIYDLEFGLIKTITV